MKILFLHGWQSTPNGIKPTNLKDHGHEVLNPGETVVLLDKWDLATEYRLTQPGRYTVQFRGGVDIADADPHKTIRIDRGAKGIETLPDYCEYLDSSSGADEVQHALDALEVLVVDLHRDGPRPHAFRLACVGQDHRGEILVAHPSPDHVAGVGGVDGATAGFK